MKKTLCLLVLVLLLFIACSPVQDSESKPDLEELTDDVYVGYDRTKYENVSAQPIYYAESIRPNDSALASLFVKTPKIYDTDAGTGVRHHTFENESEHGYYGSHGIVSYRTNDGSNIHIASQICLTDDMSSVKELDFMSLEELYKKFDEDVHKFIDNYEIYEMTAFTANKFEEITALTEPSNREKGWCEPRDVYYIRARQFVNDVPIFTGISPTNVDTMFHYGAKIEACYTEDGLEYFDIIGGYKIGEEKPADGEFIDLKGAEQIIRDEYEIPYGYENIVFDDVGLVYVGVFEGDKTILTPAWEFYVEVPEHSITWKSSMVWERINAYTGEFMR